MANKHRTFEKEYKQETVRLVQSSGKSMCQVAQELGISKSNAHRWCAQMSTQQEHAFPGSGHQTPPEEELRQLRHENEILRQERDVLKKTSYRISRLIR